MPSPDNEHNAHHPLANTMSIVANSVAACFPAATGEASSQYALPEYGDAEANGASTPSARPGLLGRRHRTGQVRGFSWRRLVSSYWTDWLLILCLWIILFSISAAPGFQREFSLREISIQHSFASVERVPLRELILISLGVPLVCLVILSIFVARNSWDVHNSVTGLFMAWTMAGVVTNVVKMMVGRPRPDLIARCIPREGAADAAVYGLSNITICTQTDKLILYDGFKSFPSGHSSLSFAGLGFLTLYLAGKMHLWDVYGNRNRAWFALLPLLLAAIIAISRTQDNRHHWHDVLVGSTLGFVVAMIAYRTYYPPLAHPTCHLPLLPRPTQGPEDAEEDAGASGVRLLHDDSGVPRHSEEQDAWRTT